jgi:hypothetical protein
VAGDDPLLRPIEGARHESYGGVEVDIVPAGTARIKRLIYPPGSRWSLDRKPLVGTDFCLHAHVGFLARGRLDGEYDDGCSYSFIAPQVIVLEPGHDTWVVGDEPAVFIQFDFEADTTDRLGIPSRHTHS